jgi:heme/copper-type cytochrome/quinol oxidase subunit 2
MLSETIRRRGNPPDDRPDLAWSVPVMRVGFAGRGLVYLAVALFSLYAIWRGGRAQGTAPVLRHFEHSVAGDLLLALIGLGMVAFATWRAVEAYYDLDDRGSDAQGIAARLGLAVSGLVALGIGGAALLLLLADLGGSGGVAASAAAAGAGDGGSGAGGSQIDDAVMTIMGWPGGRWIVGLVGLAILGSGIFQFVRAAIGTYRRYLIANQFTWRWDWVLKAGVIARGAIIGVVGVLFLLAAWWANPWQAGGVDKAFAWMTGQPYGRVAVAAICVGLLGYALFCFVNAAYRFVPRVAPADVKALEARAKEMLRPAT